MKSCILLVLCLSLTNAQLSPKKKLVKPVVEFADEIPFDDVACGVDRPLVLTDPWGTFVSPNYPGLYPNNANCWWLIKTDQPDHVIELNFDALQTEVNYDGIIINDGETTSSMTITGFDGSYTNPPKGIRSSGPSMLFRFISDGSVPHFGFNASYEAVPFDSTPDACYSATRPEILTDPSGTFTSRGYPTDNYWNYADCQWRIDAITEGEQVTLRFDYFQTEGAYDFVYVFDSKDSSGDHLATLHGNLGAAGPFTSTSGSLFVLFISDGTINDVGFSASYTSA